MIAATTPDPGGPTERKIVMGKFLSPNVCPKFVDALNLFRRQLPISQLTLGRAVGLNATSIPNLESGTLPGNLFDCSVIARMLGMPQRLLYFARPIVLDEATEAKLRDGFDGRVSNGGPSEQYPSGMISAFKPTVAAKKAASKAFADQVNAALDKKKLDIRTEAAVRGIDPKSLTAILDGTLAVIPLMHAANLAELLKLPATLESFAPESAKRLPKLSDTELDAHRVRKVRAKRVSA